MGSKLDALLKLSIIAAVLFASASVGYYFLVYLPQCDARLDAQLTEEKERAGAAKQAKDEQQAEEQLLAQARYKTCVDTAEKNYNAVWASNCKSAAQQRLADRAHCILGKELCDSDYPPRDPSPNCALPRQLANDIDAALEKARNRCLQESKAGL